MLVSDGSPNGFYKKQHNEAPVLVPRDQEELRANIKVRFVMWLS